MPALMAQRSSPGLNKIRRELKNRRKAVTAPKGGVAKRSSALPPPVPLGRTAPISSASTGTALVDSTKRGAAKNCSGQPLPTATAAAPRKIDYIPMGEIIQRCTAPPRVKPIFRTALSPKKPPSPCPVSSIDSSSCSSSKTAMPVLMARRPSAELRAIRRELEQRRKLAGVARGGIVKKSSPQHSSSIQKPSEPMPHDPAGAATKKPALPMSSSILQAPAKKSAAPISVHTGMTVKVRRLVGTLPRTGKRPQRLVLWLSAVVVSDAEDGYIEVIYNGYNPGDDRFRTVRVAIDDVKHMPAIAEN